MHCQSCQKHLATVHQIEVVWHGSGLGPEDRELRILHLCAPCAKAAGLAVPPGVPSFPKVVSLLSKALLQGGPPAPAGPREAGKGLTCPECGWSLRDFQQTSRFGCPRDYEVFEDFVTDLLEKVHGTSEHPVQEEEAELSRLVHLMNEAAAQEDYETAARLRDQIRALEAGLQESSEGGR